jgi:hypothetical protein
LPDSPSFEVSVRWRELPLKLREPKTAEAVDGTGRVLRRVRLDASSGEVRLTNEPEASAYRVR